MLAFIATYIATAFFLSCCGAFAPTSEGNAYVSWGTKTKGTILSFNEESNSIIFSGDHSYVPSEKMRIRLYIPTSTTPKKENGIPVSLSKLSYPHSATVIYSTFYGSDDYFLSSETPVTPPQGILRVSSLTVAPDQ